MKPAITQKQAKQLLHNKFVVVLGDSVQRGIYKDLVLLLQEDRYLYLSELKTKGEITFDRDCLVEGGRLGHMNNGTEYKEVRQYCTDHHLMRFYFLTRIFSGYTRSILEDFRRGPQPDVIIVSSCVWDISRYGSGSFQQYKENLHVFFREIKDVVHPDCLILWNMAMPLGKKITGGFLVPEVSHMASSLRHDIIEANFYGAETADTYDCDVLDLHYHFRLSLQHRMPDGIHWDAVAHRRISGLLLHHIADAWGVDLHDPSSTQIEGIKSHHNLEHIRKRPERPRPTPLQDIVPFQRCVPVQHQQSKFRSDRYQPYQPPHYAGYRPLGPRNRGMDQSYQDSCPAMDSRFTTDEDFHHGADDRCMRRKKRTWRPNSYHPYHSPYKTPRHSAHGWTSRQLESQIEEFPGFPPH